jgi:hypothetical protein
MEDSGDTPDTMDGGDAVDSGNSADIVDTVDAMDAPGWLTDEEDPFLAPEPYHSLPVVTVGEEDLTQLGSIPERDPPPAQQSMPAQAGSLQEGDWFWPLLPGGARHSQSPWQVVEIVTAPNKPTMVYGQTATGKLNGWLLERCQRAEPPGGR